MIAIISITARYLERCFDDKAKEINIESERKSDRKSKTGYHEREATRLTSITVPCFGLAEQSMSWPNEPGDFRLK